MTNSVPEFMNPSKAIEANEIAKLGNAAADRLRERGVAVTADADPNAPRMFLSPTHPNGKFLVEFGAVEDGVLIPGQSMRPALKRKDDVWCRFTSGVCSTHDPKIIDWLEAHSGDPVEHREYHEEKKEDPRACGTPIGLCREKNDVAIDDWYKMKLAQQALSTRDIGLDPDIDVDAYTRGNAPVRRSKRASDAISRVVEAEENADRERADGMR